MFALLEGRLGRTKSGSAGRLVIATPWLLLAALWLGSTASAWAGAGAGAVDALDGDFEVIEISTGFVLQPLSMAADFSLIEISDGVIRVDGEVVSAERLEVLVGEHAAALWTLAEVGAEGEDSTNRDSAGTSANSATSSADTSSSDTSAPSATSTASSTPETEPETDTDSEADSEPTKEPVTASRHESGRSSRGDRQRRSTRYRRHDPRVSVGSGLTVDEDEQTKDVVVVGGSLDVRGEVDGDATVIFGSSQVSGRVDGDMTVVGGSLYMEPGGHVDGEVVTVGGGVYRERDTRIDGEVVQVDVGRFFDFGRHWDRNWSRSWLFGNSGSSGFAVVKEVVLAGLLYLLVLFFLTVAPNRVPEIAARARQEPVKAGLVGVMSQLAFLPVLGLVSLVLVISIIGIPLALLVPPLMAVLFVVVAALGFSAVAMSLGEWLRSRFDLAVDSPYVLAFFGLLLIQGWTVFGEMLSIIGGPIGLWAYLLLIVGFLVSYAAWTVGLGAAVLRHYSQPTQFFGGSSERTPYGWQNDD